MTTAMAPPSRRERKKLATREALHEAALSLVEDRGLANVTIEDITERADVAPRTFFNYYSSKEDAVIGRAPNDGGALVAALQARPHDEAVLDSVRQVMTDDFVARAVESQVLLRRIRVIKSEPQLLSRMTAQFDQLERGMVDEVARRIGQDPAVDFEPSLLVTVVFAACRAALMHWCERGGRGSIVEVLDAAFERLAAGFDATPGPPPGAPVSALGTSTQNPPSSTEATEQHEHPKGHVP